MLYGLGPRAERVYRALLERIRSTQLGPGTRLPAHARLAEEFGVAPLTMRQVLARLEADGLLARERGRGTFVRSVQEPRVLIVAADPARQRALFELVQTSGHRAVVAGTTAEALAAVDREPSVTVAVLDLRLLTLRSELPFIRMLRHRAPRLTVAVLTPTGRQRARLARTVAPPLHFVDDPVSVHLTQLLRVVLATHESSSQHMLHDVLERYLALQLAGERAAARVLMLQQRREGGVSVADLYQRVLQPAQYRIGELWQANQIGVAREHLATAITEAVLFDVAAAASRAPDIGIRVLVACVEGELHDIGARMVADLFELDGFSVQYLGADVPTEGVLEMLRENPPRLLVLSATMVERLVLLRALVSRVRQQHGLQVGILIGGQIVDWLPRAVSALDVDLATRDALETLAGARRIVSA
jgi:methanogenic corrinoid protein MtbC1/DNA-binding transcriptional regulator YhcF (GntR family)